MFKNIFNSVFSKKSKPLSRFDHFITENSPAEVSVIDFSENNMHSILYINKTKATEFGVKNAEEIVGKKCYEFFEGKDEPCIGCPSFEALMKQKRIHKDWEYYQPNKKEKRFASITAKPIDDTNYVVEICRDSTIRKIVSDLIVEMASIHTIEELDILLATGLLTKLFFKRYRYYQFDVDNKMFKLKSAYISVTENQSSKIELDQKTINEELSNSAIDSVADAYIVKQGIQAKPNLYLISEFISNFDKSLFDTKYCQVLENKKDYTDNQILKKQQFPVWLDIPIVSKNKIIGKISIDKEESNWNKNIDEYDFNFFEILGRSISKTIENLNLLDQTGLHNISEIVLNYSIKNKDLIFHKILEHGTQYLDTIHSGLLINFNEGNQLYFQGQANGKVISTNPPFNLILLRETLMYDSNIIYGRDHVALFKKYFSGNIDTNKILLKPLQIENKVLGLLLIYDFGDKHNEEYFSRKFNLLANQMVLAINKMQQYYEIESQRAEAVRNAKKAQESLNIRNDFFDAANHEIIAPIGPILHCLMYMKIKNSQSTDVKLSNMIQNSIYNCEFLVKAFDNIDFVNPKKEIKLKKCYCQLFKDIIIPMVVTCKYYAQVFNRDIEYSGIKYVAEHVTVDKDLMMHIFFNLIHNAIRYSHKNTTIYIKGVMVVDNVSYIDVVNYGIGIQEREKEKIFEKYYRANNAKISDIQGTGIGLYIVKKILNTHGGDIVIHKNNDPTIFRLKIPNNNEL